ncbi:DUF4097 family beta strand repeat-containing protein [Gemella morbillorum]
MNKFIKIAFSLIITGIILIGFATYLNNGNIPRFSANYDKKNYTVSINEIKDLDLNILDSDIVLEENTSSDKIEIDYYTSIEREILITHTDKKLSIKENKNIFGIDIDFSIFFKKREIKIKVPKSSNINVYSLNKVGSLTIRDLSIKHLTANNKMGDIYLTNVSALDTDIKLSTGDVKIDNFKSDNNFLKIKSATGDIKLSNLKDFNLLSIDNNTGNIDLSSSIIKNINITNKLGNITLSNLPSETSDNINLETKTGDISLFNLTVNNSIFLKSTTGNILAELNDNESNFTNGSNKKKTLFTSSSTGTVTVKFLNK